MAITGKQLAEIVETPFKEKWGYIWATAGETWTESKQASLVKKYNNDPAKYSDLKSGVQYGAKWIGHKVTDCSGLVKWAMGQLGVTKGIYHGSNSQFNKNCSMTGKVERGVDIPVGALIFTGNEVGQHNHVGVLVTPTCVCEAKGTQAGVVHTPLSNKKWTYWGLLKGVSYDTAALAETVATPVEPADGIPATTQILVTYHTLRRGDKGEYVKMMQTYLAKHGSNLEIDGIFGKGTLSAVKTFQKKNHLVVDGIVGPKTWAMLVK